MVYVEGQLLSDRLTFVPLVHRPTLRSDVDRGKNKKIQIFITQNTKYVLCPYGTSRELLSFSSVIKESMLKNFAKTLRADQYIALSFIFSRVQVFHYDDDNCAGSDDKGLKLKLWIVCRI